MKFVEGAGDERAARQHILYGMTMHYERLLTAAQRVLDGDDSNEAANELTRVVRDDYPGDERFDELLDVLARAAPDHGSARAVPEEVRTVVRETLARVM